MTEGICFRSPRREESQKISVEASRTCSGVTVEELSEAAATRAPLAK